MIERRRGWCEQAAAGLDRTFIGGFHGIPGQVNAGQAELYRIQGPGVSVWLVTASYAEPAGPVLAVHNVQGRGLLTVARVIIEQAREAGFAAVRFTTHTKGLGRLVGRYGFRQIAASGENSTWGLEL